MRIAGIVLAGGRSSRMGRTKALVEIDGRAMANVVVDALRSAGCDPVVVFGGDPAELMSIDAPVLADLHPDEGPVGGIVGALSWLRERNAEDTGGAASMSVDAALVVACDLPRLGPATLDPLMAAATSWPVDVDVIVARAERVEPMCAVWRTSAVDLADAAFRTGIRSMHGLLAAVAAEEIDVPTGGLHNVNTPADLDA